VIAPVYLISIVLNLVAVVQFWTADSLLAPFVCLLTGCGFYFVARALGEEMLS
jgi:hypothetical protein